MTRDEAASLNKIGHDMRNLYVQMSDEYSRGVPRDEQVYHAAFLTSAYSAAEFLTLIKPSEEQHDQA